MAHWRDTARNVRLWIVDFRACFPLLVLLFHIRLWTFIVAIITTGFFALLERYGFSLIVFYALAALLYCRTPQNITALVEEVDHGFFKTTGRDRTAHGCEFQFKRPSHDHG